VATVTVIAHQYPFVLDRAHAGALTDTIILEFSTTCGWPDGRLMEEGATDAFNYEVSGGLMVRSARLDCTGLRVCLVTSPQESSTQYTVKATLLLDDRGWQLPTSTATFTSLPREFVEPGTLKYSLELGLLILQWASGGALQFAETPAGPWSDVEFAESPFFVSSSPLGCNSSTDEPRFYRVRWPVP
jgi:hypothetical protein